MGRSEEIVGKAIAGRRDEVVLATKCGLVWHTTRATTSSTRTASRCTATSARSRSPTSWSRASKRLGTDHIDLYITHWQDPTTPVAETMGALDDLKRAGKIRAIGASNLTTADLEAYLAAGGLDAVQEQYSMVHRDIEAETRCRSASRTACPILELLVRWRWACSPARSARSVSSRATISASTTRASASANRRKVADFAAEIAPIATAHGATIAELVIAWTIRQPGITFSLCGARNPDQAKENARAGSIRLGEAELAGITAAATRHLAGIHG